MTEGRVVMKRNVLVVGVAVIAFPLAACTTPEEKAEKAAEKVEQAVVDVCDEIDALEVALARYGEISAETPIATVKSATAEVERSWNELDKALQKLDKAEARAMNATYDQFRSTVEAIPDSTTLGEASVQFAAALEDLQIKKAALQSVACPE
jgi:hypothetical protein